MNTRRLYHIIRMVMLVVAAFSLTGCNLLQNTGKNIESVQIASENTPSEDASLAPRISEILASTNLVINDIPINKNDFFEQTEGSFTELMIDSEVLRYTLKKSGITNIYPEFTADNGKIKVVWMDKGEPVLTVDMAEGSKEASVNDRSVTLKVAPKTLDERLYIPISPFVEALGMKETSDDALNLKLIHCGGEYTTELLLGNWSDSDTCLFETFDNAMAGKAGIPTFAVGYEFNEDGTYRYMIIGADGFKDTLLLQEGKYKLYGSIVVYYDIQETLYEGNPLELVYKDTPLDHPFFEFIGNYDAENAQMVIGDFLLNKVVSKQ